MQVVDINFVLDGVIAELIGGSVSDTSPNTSSCQPDGKAIRVMVSSITSLGHGGAAEFAGPEHQRGLEQSPLFEVSQQTRDGLIDRNRVIFVTFLEVTVLIPAIVSHIWAEEFDEADAAFDQAAGDEALPSEDRGAWFIQAVKPLCKHSFSGQIE